jgi:uncharacterized membrane protein YozB (DUF420 family)
MTASVLFWTGAMINLIFIAGLVVSGVRQVRGGEIARHRRSMLTAGALVVGFLLAYVGKVILLGKEDLSVWSRTDVNILRFHETCVTLMLLAGVVALIRAMRMRGTRIVTRNPEDPQAPEGVVRFHRWAGRIALVGCFFGLLSAGFVLAGMFSRL